MRSNVEGFRGSVNDAAGASQPRGADWPCQGGRTCWSLGAIEARRALRLVLEWVPTAEDAGSRRLLLADEDGASGDELRLLLGLAAASPGLGLGWPAGTLARCLVGRRLAESGHRSATRPAWAHYAVAVDPAAVARDALVLGGRSPILAAVLVGRVVERERCSGKRASGWCMRLAERRRCWRPEVVARRDWASCACESICRAGCEVWGLELVEARERTRWSGLGLCRAGCEVSR